MQKPTPHSASFRHARSLYALVAAMALCLSAASHGQDFTIGVIAGLSGPGKSYGAGIVQGAEMAVQEINAAGGINGRKLSLKIVDDTSEPARSAIAMRRLISGNPDLIVGGWGSPQVLAHQDYPEQSAVPYIVVGATHPRITTASNRWVFRVIQTDTIMAEHLARLAVGQFGAKRIAILHDYNAYGSGSRDVFTSALARLGLKAVEIQPYASNKNEFTPQLTRIKASMPDAVIIFGTVPAAPAILNQARQMGITARFFGGGGLANEELLKLAPSAAEGAVVMSYFSPDADADAQNWSERYHRLYADKPYPNPVLGAWEYRAIRHIAAPCLQRAGDDRVALRRCIADWHGKLFSVGTEARFDNHGQLVQPPLAVVVRDGGFRLLQIQRP